MKIVTVKKYRSSDEVFVEAVESVSMDTLADLHSKNFKVRVYNLDTPNRDIANPSFMEEPVKKVSKKKSVKKDVED